MEEVKKPAKKIEVPVVSFGLGDEVTETSAEILGGKGAGLVWMDSQGINVPPGIIIPTTAWASFQKSPATTMKAIEKAITPYLKRMETKFGYLPLLSVRSGARVSCPGMMDTILNVGLDKDSFEEWSSRVGAECAMDSVKRLVVMYGNVVKGIPREDLEAETYQEALKVYRRRAEEDFPSAREQLLQSIAAVFGSWNNDRAKFYRKMNNIPDEWGTACVIQAMVFGNLNDQSGTGVLFTRNADTGDSSIMGEFLINAQGEDVVAGIATPMKLEEMSSWNAEVHTELCQTVKKLEALKKDVQDVEFTIQDGKLYILQTRNAKRSAQAGLKIALDMVAEGLLTGREALARLTGGMLDKASAPVVDPSFKVPPFATGIPACSGVVTGIPVYSAEEAVKSKVPCVLITKETTPDDIAGMNAAVGVVTMHGGATSHAAVVARGMNKPCVVGVGKDVDDFKGLPGKVSFDGATGRIWICEVPTKACPPELIAAVRSMVTTAVPHHPIMREPVKGLSGLKKVYVPLGERLLDPKTALYTLVAFRKEYPEAELLVDMANLTTKQSEYVEQCGGVDYPEVLKVLELNQDHLKNVKLLLPPGHTTGFEQVGTTANLADAVLATGSILVTGEISEAMMKVLAWKKAEGVDSVVVGKVSTGPENFASFEELLTGDAL